MKSILTELYQKLSFEEHCTHITPEYSAINERIKEEKANLISRLSPEDRENFDRLEALYTGASDIDESTSFRKGFRLGVLLMLEVYN